MIYILFFCSRQFCFSLTFGHNANLLEAPFKLILYFSLDYNWPAVFYCSYFIMPCFKFMYDLYCW